jgi:hypothetical protein
MAKKEKQGAEFAQSINDLLMDMGGLLMAMSLEGPEAVLQCLEDIEKGAAKARHIGYIDMVASGQPNVKTKRAAPKAGDVV